MSRAVRLLPLLAVALVALIGVELVFSSGDGPEIAAAPEATPPDAGAAAAQGGDGPAEFAATVLERPLFKPDRMPYPADPNGPVAAPPADMPRLTGILVYADTRTAFFQAEGSDQSIVVTEGGNVGEWRVETIAADQVIMTGPEGRLPPMKPQFAANATTATDVAAAPPMPPAPPMLPPGMPQQRGPLGNAHRQRNGGARPPQRKH